MEAERVRWGHAGEYPSGRGATGRAARLDCRAMRPVASLSAEYRASASLYGLTAAVGLVAELATRDVEAVRVVVPFLVMTVVTAAVLALTGARWVRGAAASAPPLPRGTGEERPAGAWRRAGIEVGLVAVLMLAGISAGRGIGTVIAGIAAGVGMANLLSLRWIRGREREGRVRLMRETPARLVASGRRPVFAARGASGRS